MSKWIGLLLVLGMFAGILSGQALQAAICAFLAGWNLGIGTTVEVEYQ
jgi:hypothetical protein